MEAKIRNDFNYVLNTNVNVSKSKGIVNVCVCI